MGSILHVLTVNLLRESESRVCLPYNLCVSVKESSDVTMSSLSVTTLFSSMLGGPSRGRPMEIDGSYSDIESTEKSSQVVDPLSRNNLEPAICLLP